MLRRSRYSCGHHHRRPAIRLKAFPQSETFEPEKKGKDRFAAEGSYIVYIAAISMFAMGFIDFSMITMHVARSDLMNSEFLPMLYASAMLIDAFVTLLFGNLYDRYDWASGCIHFGLRVPHGTDLHVQQYIPYRRGRAHVGGRHGRPEIDIEIGCYRHRPENKRTTGFGVFQTSLGIFWFLGSWAMGVMYDLDLPSMVMFSVVTQILAILLFLLTAAKHRKESVGTNPAPPL